MRLTEEQIKILGVHFPKTSEFPHTEESMKRDEEAFNKYIDDTQYMLAAAEGQRFEVGDHVRCITGIDTEFLGVVVFVHDSLRYYVAEFESVSGPWEVWDNEYWPEAKARVLEKIISEEDNDV